MKICTIMKETVTIVHMSLTGFFSFRVPIFLRFILAADGGGKTVMIFTRIENKDLQILLCGCGRELGGVFWNSGSVNGNRFQSRSKCAPKRVCLQPSVNSPTGI